MPLSSSDPDYFQIPNTVLERPPVVAAKTALVVVDMVNWQVPRAPNASGLAPAYYVDRLADMVIPNHQKLVEGCRQAGVAVVFLRVGCYQSNFGDAVPAFQAIMKEFDAREGTFSCEVITEIAPEASDLSLLKTGSGGFGSSALDSHLRNMGIETVFYTGVVTNGCVLLTVAGGFDLGYYGYLVSDATAAFSQELQDQAEHLMAEYLAPLVTTDDVLSLLAAPALAVAGGSL